MIRRTCPWCHSLNPVVTTGSRLCWNCGHRADVPRLDCDCPVCGPAVLPLPRLRSTADAPQSTKVKNHLPFATTQRDLALALFYEAALPTTGNGTLSEAEAQATLMLAAGKLYDACQALVALIDQDKSRIYDTGLVAVADMALEAMQAAGFTPG